MSTYSTAKMASLPPIEMDSNRDGIAISGASDTLPKELLVGAPQIETLRQRFDEARDLTLPEREGGDYSASKCRAYVNGPKQLAAKIRALLEQRRQPPIWTNLMRTAVNSFLGVLEAGRSDPRGLPRNPDDEQASDVGTKTLRYIADDTNFAEVAQEVSENFFVEGLGACIIEVEKLGDRLVIRARQIRWEEFYRDPYSRRNDFKDARYMGIAKWKDAQEIREQYGERIKEIGDPMGISGWLGSKTWEDRPEGRGWVDRKRRRIMCIEEYAIVGGVWHRIKYIATGVLEYGPSPYLDEQGQPCNPIEAVSCYVDEENYRFGPTRDMLPIQDEVNAGNSRALHLFNSRQVQKTDMSAPPVDAQVLSQEASKADGVIPPGYEIVRGVSDTMAQANMLRMQEAKMELRRMSPSPLARDLENGSAVSGRARLVAQQAGMSEIARPMSRLRDWRLRCYKQFWHRARQYWQAPMWIRVTDDLNAPEFLKINEPVMGMVMQQMQAPTGEAVQVPSVGIVGFNNRPAEIGMDIILDETPDTAILQEEVFAGLLQLLQTAGLQAVFTPEFELLIKASTLPDKARILEDIKKGRKENQNSEMMQMIQALQAQVQELSQGKAAAETAEKQASAGLKQAQTEKTGVETLILGFQAGQASVPEPAEPTKDE